MERVDAELMMSTWRCFNIQNVNWKDGLKSNDSTFCMECELTMFNMGGKQNAQVGKVFVCWALLNVKIASLKYFIFSGSRFSLTHIRPQKYLYTLKNTIVLFCPETSEIAISDCILGRRSLDVCLSAFTSHQASDTYWSNTECHFEEKKITWSFQSVCMSVYVRKCVVELMVDSSLMFLFQVW